MMELGKYAGPVLTAWGVSLALLAGIVVQSLMADARSRRDLKRVEQRRG